MLFKTEADKSAKPEKKFQPLELERQNVEYKDCSKRFYEVSRDFSKQFAHIYSARLNTFRNILEPVIYKKWANKYKILKLCELREKGTDCIIIGTLFKLQDLKQLSDQLEIIPQPPRTHFVHETDSIVLEDELQRIKLVGDFIDVHQVVTGVVCAVLGIAASLLTQAKLTGGNLTSGDDLKTASQIQAFSFTIDMTSIGSEDEDGIFTIKDICWAGCNIQKPLPKLDSDKYIVLISGLNMAANSTEHLFSLHLLMEWLSGMSGSTQYQEQLSKIVRVVIAGGLFVSNCNEMTVTESNVISSVESVDAFCAAVSTVAPLDLMPGCKDPAGVMLPQKPFHYCLFPKAMEYKSFNRVSNPYECDVAGFLCLGSSGEPMRDIMRYSKLDDPLEVMRKTLQWRHMAPTCPDTVPCTPCIDTDPFTIYNCPALYFSGNCNEFATDLYQGEEGQHVRLVCVPDFSLSKTVAVLNLSNLECYSMSFS